MVGRLFAKFVRLIKEREQRTGTGYLNFYLEQTTCHSNKISLFQYSHQSVPFRTPAPPILTAFLSPGSPLYPGPSSQGNLALLNFSNATILSSFFIVRPISSSPLTRQYFLNESISNGIVSPFGRTISCFARSTVSSLCAFASSARASRVSRGRGSGNIPFLKQLL